VSVRADSGTFMGLLSTQAWELLLPLHCSSRDFENMRSRMTGFNEASKQASLSSMGLAANSAELEILRRIRRVVNINVVQGPGIGEMQLASTMRQGGVEQRALFTVNTKRLVLHTRSWVYFCVLIFVMRCG
jgi:hypothetical protein